MVEAYCVTFQKTWKVGGKRILKDNLWWSAMFWDSLTNNLPQCSLQVNLPYLLLFWKFPECLLHCSTFSLYPWIGLHVHFSNFFRNSSRVGIVCVCVYVCVCVCVFIWVYVLIFIVPQTFQIIYISSVDERVCEGDPEQKHACFDNLVVVIQSLSSINFFVIPRTVACQAPLSMGLPRQEYWNELLFPSLRDLPNSGIKPSLLHWQVNSLPLSHQGSPLAVFLNLNNFVVFLTLYIYKKKSLQ